MLEEVEELVVMTIVRHASYNGHRHLVTLIVLALTDGDDDLMVKLKDVEEEELIWELILFPSFHFLQTLEIPYVELPCHCPLLYQIHFHDYPDYWKPRSRN